MSVFKQEKLAWKSKGAIVLGVVVCLSALASHIRFINPSPIVPPHSVHATPECPVKTNDIVAISYNIRLLPPLISAASPEHNMGRTAAIASFLSNMNPRPDIIFFQEAWSPRIREQLMVWLGDFYPHTTDTGPEDAQRSFRRAVGAGLMVMSRFPIVDRHFERFGVAAWTSADLFADKGALRVVLDVEGHNIEVVKLHLQAGDYPKVRAEQLSVVERLAGTAHLLVGDFNLDGREHLDFLVRFSDFYDAHIGSDVTSSDVWRDKRARLLDYVFSNKKLVGTCAQVLRGVYLSDHSPIMFRMTPGLKLK